MKTIILGVCDLCTYNVQAHRDVQKNCQPHLHSNSHHSKLLAHDDLEFLVQTDLQLPLRQWGAGNVLSS